ncbi:MAG TPA: EF-Tu/IF-2/RF-3 family GTPase [Pyrinomonadaceae bacterium]|nr:hypothetical protein [Chloracidobacterium sp.]MBP9934302.1 hypothetical protein [Pyrinomonadaceae bacterium]MBK7801501.1 hypothetical protein [Chloracidobacterium sp.]MBK9436819.1 hypothetical protein [Chloracidobacterium sp.]MBL0241811.1 hypothetical protein [Chloracidobacterium sp.]
MRHFIFLVGIMIFASVASPSQSPTGEAQNKPFLMSVEDVFYISGRGVVATGKIERGTIKTGDTVEIIGIRATKTATVSGIERFRKIVAEGTAGEIVGIMLRGVERMDVERGQVIADPGSTKAFTKFRAKIDLTLVSDGGRKTPMASGFRPQVMIRTGSFSGSLTFSLGKTQAAAGDKDVEVEIELTQPAPLEKGQPFTFREFGRAIATGVVSDVIPPK